MRYFNTYGPVIESEHYVVSRRQLVSELLAQNEEGKYFTIYAPRQMGKTTLLRHLRDDLKQQKHFPVTLSFASFEGLSEKDFLEGFHLFFVRQMRHLLLTVSNAQIDAVEQLLAQPAPTSFFALGEFWHTLHENLANHRLVLIIDEFDGVPQTAISNLLQTWRDIYLGSQPRRSLHSVVLVGLENIAALNLGRSSPFNIARELQLPVFTLEQVEYLLQQYSQESRQSFAEGVVREIHRYTDGHPFLVNRLSAILTEKVATERTLPITLEQFHNAHRRLLKESNFNFETLLLRAREHRDDILKIMFGERYEFNLNIPLIRTLNTHGIIKENTEGLCQIANPIYERVLLAAFRSHRWHLQASILANGYDFRPHAAGGQLQMNVLLSRFRQFVERRGREAFKVTPTPKEATGQYLLMAYLEQVVRQFRGDLFTEVDSGEGRLDLIVVHQGKRYVVETKIWYGKTAFDEGLDQLTRYLESEGQKEGYLVVFHARPRVYGKLTFDKLEFTTEHNGKTIHVYLVRLGALFQKAATVKRKT
jgi:AAA+ ATPase superfamily predicted ATPase